MKQVAKIPAEQKGEVRTLRFPPEPCIGVLSLLSRTKFGDTKVNFAKAVGVVKVRVPPDLCLEFQPNQLVFQKPELLDKMQTAGIDCVRAKTFTFDDELSKTDEILKRLSRFTDLIYLDLRQSDVTDAGLLHVTSLKRLVSIDIFETPVKGECFKTFAGFPELLAIEMSSSEVNQTNLVYLSGIKKLKVLNLRRIRLDQTGLTHVAQCKNLEDLDIGFNPKIDDRCISLLLSLPKLETLRLDGTAITFQGMKQLKTLTKLTFLELPPSIKGDTQLQELKKLFPRCELRPSGKHTVSNDERVIFAPLK